MKFFQMKLMLFVSVLAAIGLFVAADHIDAPAVSGGSSDLTDLFAFESPENSANLVFVANTQGLLDPASTATTTFDPNLMVEINIDNNGDFVEDLVIQCVYQYDKLWVYGPMAPLTTGTQSKINAAAPLVQVALTTYGNSASIGEGNGMKVFAGPRDDPFFFDFNQFVAILGGNAAGFNSPGDDTFAGTNVLSTVIEVPKSQLGGTGTLNVWVESKKK